MRRILLTTLFLSLTTVAAAAPIGVPLEFDFTQPDGANTDETSFSFTNSGVTVTATPNSSNDATFITQNYPGGIFGLDYGLGVSSGNASVINTFFGPISISAETAAFVNSTQIEGTESLTFTPSADVPVPNYTLEAIIFSRGGGNDDFSLEVDGVLVLSGIDVPGTEFGAPVTLDLLSLTSRESLTGNSFNIFAPGDNDAFKVAGLILVANPEPSSFLIWGLGATGLALAVRRQRRKAKTVA